MKKWVFGNGKVTCYRPVKEEPLSALTATQRGYIRAIFRAFPGDMERILLELSALRYCSLKTALRSAVRDGCLTEQEAEEHYLDFNQEVAKLPTRSVEYITALASGYNAGVKYNEIAAYVGKSVKTVLNDLYSLRKGTTTRHLFKGNENYGNPKNSPFVRVRGPVPEWSNLIETPFSEAKEEGAPPEMLPDPRGAKGEVTGESACGETPPSQPHGNSRWSSSPVPPPLAGEASKAGSNPSVTADARAIDDLEELINGGAAFLSALPHEDFPTETSSGGGQKTAEGVNPSITITAGSLTVTVSAGADITIHITQGGNNNV